MHLSVHIDRPTTSQVNYCHETEVETANENDLRAQPFADTRSYGPKTAADVQLGIQRKETKIKICTDHFILGSGEPRSLNSIIRDEERRSLAGL